MTFYKYLLNAANELSNVYEFPLQITNYSCVSILSKIGQSLLQTDLLPFEEMERY